MISLFIVYVIDIYVNLYCVHTYIIKTSWRYSDLISRSFYIHFIFYIIYTDIFIPIKGGDGCHLRVVPPGQLLRRPSTPKPFIEPGFVIFFDVKFFVFAFRWLRVFH